MKELIGLVATLVEASGATERRRSAAGAILTVAAGTLIGLAAIGVLICLLAAVWLYEEPLIGEVGAPLVVAAVLAGVTIIAALILHHKTSAPEPPPAAGLNIAAAANVAQSVMRSHKFLVLLGALAIGLAAGENDGRR